MSTKRWDSSNSMSDLKKSLEAVGLLTQGLSKFPTVAELAAESAHASAPDRPRGLYQELLLSRPEPLYADVLDHPEKYPETVMPILRSLLETRREPTEEERKVLDAAVIDFATKTREQKVPTPRPAKRQKKKELEHRMPELSSDATSPPALPDGEMKPFWWL